MDSRRFDHSKYQAFQPVAKSDRRWPDQLISVAPQWCSVDLRDGNQALVEPMNAEAPPVPAADEEVDLHDLVDAPSHTDEIIERLTEAFPGAELQTKESTEEP